MSPLLLTGAGTLEKRVWRGASPLALSLPLATIALLVTNRHTQKVVLSFMNKEDGSRREKVRVGGGGPHLSPPPLPDPKVDMP